MKLLSLIKSIVLFSVSFAFGVWPFSQEVSPIAGNWQFVDYIYEGEKQTRPNPQLVLQYEFFETGLNRLFWIRKNETGFCERHARYIYNEPWIEQEVTWVNPENAAECSQDVDMQMGNKNKARLENVDGKLHLYIPFKGEHMIYVLHRIR